MKFPRFNGSDRFWIWYLLIILGIYVIGALVWQTVSPTIASNSSSFQWMLNLI